MPTGALITTGIRAVSVTVDPPSIVTVSESDQAVTVPGIKSGDLVVAVSPGSVSNAGYYIRRAVVSADDTVTITWRNESTGTVDPASLTLTFLFIPLPASGLVAYPMGYQR
jgi:hypothetical protein